MSHSCPVLTIHDMVSGSCILPKIEVADTAENGADEITPLSDYPMWKWLSPFGYAEPVMEHQPCGWFLAYFCSLANDWLLLPNVKMIFSLCFGVEIYRWGHQIISKAVFVRSPVFLGHEIISMAAFVRTPVFGLPKMNLLGLTVNVFLEYIRLDPLLTDFWEFQSLNGLMPDYFLQLPWACSFRTL